MQRIIVNQSFGSKLKKNSPRRIKLCKTPADCNFLPSFQTPDPSLSLADLIQAAVPGVDISSIEPPPGLPSLSNVFIHRIHVDLATKAMSADVKLAGQTFTLIPNYLSLDEIAFHFSVLGKSFNATISGVGSLGPLDFDMTIAKEGGAVSATTNIPSLSLTHLASNLGSAGSDVTSFMSNVGLSDFTLRDIFLEVKTSPKQLNFKATASYKTLPDVHVEFLVYKPFTNDSTIAIALETEAVALNEIIGTFVDGVDISEVPFIGSASLPAASIILVNRNIPVGVTLPFRASSLAELSSALDPDVRISALFPVTFPRVGSKNLRASLKKVQIDFTVRRSECLT